ncbi:MAG: alpha-amylase [Alteromonadaceae bacterium]|jgi:alpha-amylase
MTPALAATTGGEIPPEYSVNIDSGDTPPLNMYLRGGFNNWGIATPLEYANGLSTAIVDLDVGQFQFKVADENWSSGTNCGAKTLEGSVVRPGNSTTLVECNSGNTPNMTLDITEAGEHQFFFSFSQNGQSQFQAIPLQNDIEADLPTIGKVTIHYKRAALSYDAWGVHLTGEAIQASWETTIKQPHGFDKVVDGWAVKEVHIVANDVDFNFIVLAGANQSPATELHFVPGEFGNDIWVVQDDTTLYHNQADTAASLAMVGKRSVNVDFSAVEKVDTLNKLGKDWNKSASFMEIFVRSYQDSDGDGIGDIQGLISRLDHLQSLGVTGLWLMPMTQSGDHDHGYAVEDFRSIEPDYGTMADFEQLIEQAHARGIGIVLDYLLNHAAGTNPLFLDASSSVDHPLHDWFVFSDNDPQWGEGPIGSLWQPSDGGYYYGLFGGQMPDFNMKNPQVIDYHLNNMRFWLNKGVDGFRYDAVMGLVENGKNAWLDQPGNHPIMKTVQDLVMSYTDRYLVCESPINQANFASKASCGRAFAFEVGRAYTAAATTGILSDELVNHLRSPIRDQLAVFISNHDTFAGNRLFNRLAGDEDSYKQVASMYLLTTSTPFTYYGEEVGVAGAAGIFGDGAIRQPMSWNDDSQTAGFTTATPYRTLSANVSSHNVAAQLGQPDSLLTHYQSMFQLRKNYPVLGTGELVLQSATGDAHLVFTRSDKTGQNMVAVMNNLSHETQQLTVNVAQARKTFNLVLSAGGDLSVGNKKQGDKVKSDANGNITLNVPPRTTIALARKKVK